MSISIITPVHTPVHGKFKKYSNMIEKIGKNLNEQSLKPKEWILICDKNSEWIKELSLPDFSNILIAQKNNISLKRNIALDNANGDFILFLDSDQIPSNKKLLEECLIKTKNGCEILLIPEKFSFTGSYLKKSYHHLRSLYWLHSKEGIPRFYKRSIVGDNRFDQKKLHFEDQALYEKIRMEKNEGSTNSFLIHDEDFEIKSNLRKVRIGYQQSKKHNIGSSFRLKFKTIIKETPVQYLPGVLFILFTRAAARRILPVENDTAI